MAAATARASTADPPVFHDQAPVTPANCVAHRTMPFDMPKEGRLFFSRYSVVPS